MYQYCNQHQTQMKGAHLAGGISYTYHGVIACVDNVSLFYTYKIAIAAPL